MSILRADVIEISVGYPLHVEVNTGRFGGDFWCPDNKDLLIPHCQSLEGKEMPLEWLAPLQSDAFGSEGAGELGHGADSTLPLGEDLLLRHPSERLLVSVRFSRLLASSSLMSVQFSMKTEPTSMSLLGLFNEVKPTPIILASMRRRRTASL